MYVTSRRGGEIAMRPFALGLLSIVAAAVLSGGAVAGGSGAKQGGTITLGYAIGLTGAASAFDVPIYQSAKIAVADINRAGGVAGRKLAIFAVDTQSKFSNGPAAAQQAIEKGAQIVFSSCDYDFGGPAQRQANKQKVFGIACAGDPKMGRSGIGPLTFNFFPPAPAEAGSQAQYAINRGWKRAYMLVDSSIQYSKKGCEYVETAYKRIGGTIVAKDTFLNSDPTIAPQVSRLRQQQRNVDVILLCSYVPGVTTAIKQIRSGGVNLPMVAQIGVDGRTIVKGVPDLSGLYYASIGLPLGGDPNPAVVQLGKKFLAAGGSRSAPDWGIVAGYSGVQMAAYALRQSKGSTDPERLKAILEKAKNVPLLWGTVTYSTECHNPIGAAVKFASVTNGKLSLTKPVKPSFVPPYTC
jgi:branched-chain amino acid transport system substrate-binding protein